MRVAIDRRRPLGSLNPSSVWIDSRSRDDIPKVLLSVQQLYSNVELRTKMFDLLEEAVLQNREQHGHVGQVSGSDPLRDRPGLTLWRAVVLALTKQALKCNFDHLAELASHHLTVREMLVPVDSDRRRFSVRAVRNYTELLSEDLLRQVNLLLAQAGR